MPKNKNALMRYLVLNDCFKNTGRMYFWEDLLEVCNKALLEENPRSEGIQRRQLFDDIRFMESESGWSIPLKRFRYGRRTYYRYEDPSYCISNQPLNLTEKEQINSVLQVFSRIAGSPQFEWVQEIIPLLKSKFGLVPQQQEIIRFENNAELKGLDLIGPLFNAITNKRVLKVIYKDFKNAEPYEITFHPYYLKQYNNRWFVFGLHQEKDVPTWNLALDRIEELAEIPARYQPSSMDWDGYFYDIIGVSRPKDQLPIEIQLQFSSSVAPYVVTKPIHPTQKHRTTASGLDVRIKVIPNYELQQLILSFGEQVQVLAPESLRQEILNRIAGAIAQY